MKVHQASQEMKLFFEKLLALKKFVKERSVKSKDTALIDEIYTKLDEIIKEGK